ncbi:MAG: Similar to phosphoglycolate phosphatase, clustered with ribosomal large subunit pseudouridine synthase C [uncultured Acidimicrobiales bacterium]|uniref:Similar to phosphoglycolate phosphatase, clustered with ribosomal large subunit pseudouridine synthase C n=1 Tax=uncultured Acidimicrobiales bacterium TaxID=310071 RepID=A0A6J4HCW1_9ACTN|nr:MAG: Similar to phosphoglycolate phosphatase, clustered with ribosomal large subunit pseudouridine synthase C [uncultured Acidimicrobiales bacterium]
MITVVALDMAGTTVIDGGAVEQSFHDAFATLGLTPTGEQLDHVRTTMGQSKIEVFRALLGEDEAARRATTAFEAAYDRQVREEGVRPIPGVEALFDDLRARGTRICLTTGFSASTRSMLLERLGWDDLVDLALSPGDGVRGRPFPDLVLTAAMRLGAEDVRDVAVAGDTASDLLAGTRAGASVVAGVLTGAHDRAALEAAPHTHILDSVVELADHL